MAAADVAQHPFDLRQEAHVGHAVGLVDDDVADVAEVDDPAVDEIDEPAWRRHHDLGTLVEAGDLPAHLCAAVDGHQAERAGPEQRPQDLGSLHGQFAGRNEHESGRAPG